MHHTLWNLRKASLYEKSEGGSLGASQPPIRGPSGACVPGCLRAWELAGGSAGVSQPPMRRLNWRCWSTGCSEWARQKRVGCRMSHSEKSEEVAKK